jgi:high-affinity iron transporter
MLQIIIVVFREIFEIALITGILTAATKKISGRGKYIASGLFLGFTGSLALAFFTDKISEGFDGLGQEVFNGVILASAAVMISWTILWMQKHAKTISGELKHLGQEVKTGKAPLYSLLLVILFSTLREGAEVVLFTYSSFISGVDLQTILTGFAVGLSLGVAFGLALYFGMLKFFGRYFFPITTWILIFFASGILAQAFGFWINADLVPALADPLWDTSSILPQTEMFGKFLHIFFGYIDHPAGMQVIAYSFSLLFLTIGLHLTKK